eukprot:450488-Alexandrium_andersonii.AAC.1
MQNSELPRMLHNSAGERSDTSRCVCVLACWNAHVKFHAPFMAGRELLQGPHFQFVSNGGE